MSKFDLSFIVGHYELSQYNEFKDLSESSGSSTVRCTGSLVPPKFSGDFEGYNTTKCLIDEIVVNNVTVNAGEELKIFLSGKITAILIK